MIETVVGVVARIVGWMDVGAGAVSVLLGCLLIAEDTSLRKRGVGLLVLGAAAITIGSYLLGWW